MTSYQTFLRAVFGNQYTIHAPYLQTINLYCLFVITLVISLCVYTIHRFRNAYDRSFAERVHSMRAQYATTQRTGYG